MLIVMLAISCQNRKSGDRQHILKTFCEHFSPVVDEVGKTSKCSSSQCNLIVKQQAISSVPKSRQASRSTCKVKRRKTKRERNNVKFGKACLGRNAEQTSVGTSKKACHVCRCSLHSFCGSRPVSTSTKMFSSGPKPVIITENRLTQHLGIFNKEVKSASIDRLLPQEIEELGEAPESLSQQAGVGAEKDLADDPHMGVIEIEPEPVASVKDSLNGYGNFANNISFDSTNKSSLCFSEKEMVHEVSSDKDIQKTVVEELAVKLVNILNPCSVFLGRNLLGEARQALIGIITDSHGKLPDLPGVGAHRNIYYNAISSHKKDCESNSDPDVESCCETRKSNVPSRLSDNERSSETGKSNEPNRCRKHDHKQTFSSYLKENEHPKPRCIVEKLVNEDQVSKPQSDYCFRAKLDICEDHHVNCSLSPFTEQPDQHCYFGQRAAFQKSTFFKENFHKTPEEIVVQHYDHKAPFVPIPRTSQVYRKICEDCCPHKSQTDIMQDFWSTQEQHKCIFLQADKASALARPYPHIFTSSGDNTLAYCHPSPLHSSCQFNNDLPQIQGASHSSEYPRFCHHSRNAMKLQKQEKTVAYCKKKAFTCSCYKSKPDKSGEPELGFRVHKEGVEVKNPFLVSDNELKLNMHSDRSGGTMTTLSEYPRVDCMMGVLHDIPVQESVMHCKQSSSDHYSADFLEYHSSVPPVAGLFQKNSSPLCVQKREGEHFSHKKQYCYQARGLPRYMDRPETDPSLFIEQQIRGSKNISKNVTMHKLPRQINMSRKSLYTTLQGESGGYPGFNCPQVWCSVPLSSHPLRNCHDVRASQLPFGVFPPSAVVELNNSPVLNLHNIHCKQLLEKSSPEAWVYPRMKLY